MFCCLKYNRGQVKQRKDCFKYLLIVQYTFEYEGEFPLTTLHQLPCVPLFYIAGQRAKHWAKRRKAPPLIPFPLCFPLFLFYITLKVQLTFLLFKFSFKNFSQEVAGKVAFYDDIYRGLRRGGGNFYSIICDKWWSPAELHGGKLTLTPYVY